LAGVRDIFLLQSVQTGVVVHPAFYEVGVRDACYWSKVARMSSWIFTSI